MTDIQRYPNDMPVPEIVEEYARLRAQVEDGVKLRSKLVRARKWDSGSEFAQVLGEQEVRVAEGYHSYVNRIEEMIRDGEDVPEGLRWAAVDRLLDDDYYGRYLDDVQEWPEEPSDDTVKKSFDDRINEALKGLI